MPGPGPLPPATMTPPLLTPPEELVVFATATPVWPAEIVPLLAMPPAKPPIPDTPTLETLMPLNKFAAILPLLVMPPWKVATL
jgi:hypothetical protein